MFLQLLKGKRGDLYSSLADTLAQSREQCKIQFGPMNFKKPIIKVLSVFPKEDAQSEAFKWASEKLSYTYNTVVNGEQAVEKYQRHHIVIIDARQPKNLDALAVCKALKAAHEVNYTCVVALVKRSTTEREEAAIIPFLKAGFNKWIIESCNLAFVLNELLQLEHNEVNSLVRLQAAQSLFTALDRCKDLVVITNNNHCIQYVNRMAIKLFGSSRDELIGKNTEELYKVDSIKSDLIESINSQVKKGKEWEGNLFTKRKTGESIALWSKISPVDFHDGEPGHLVYVKEVPYFPERHFSADTEFLPLSTSNLKGFRKASCDVRSLCSEDSSMRHDRETNSDIKSYFAGMHRRQSFARFHAMTIEAPITKVINMLLATQENCPMFVAQSLDKALDILRSTELYSPQFTQQSGKVDSQIASDLVSGLITANNKAGFRRLSHEASFKGLPSALPSHSGALPSLSTANPNIKSLLDNRNEWGFDIIELEKITEKRPLVWLGLSLFSQFNVCAALGCDDITLRNWLTMVESHYHPNPYHNSTHAADVLQATSYFLQRPRLKGIFDPMDEAVCLIAAAVHDIDHPGKNSAFLCNSKNELAILYNDVSVLESHHAALAFKLTISTEKANIFKNLDSDSYRAVRQSIIDMVLATEMTKHFEHLSKFVNVFDKSLAQEDAMLKEEPEEDHDLAGMATPENIVLVKRVLIKCADVSNPARPLNLCTEWGDRIATEYCTQTDEEKARGMSVVMPAFDRATCNIPKSQIGFIDFFVNDMFDTWDAFGDFPEVIDHLKENYLYWKEQEQLINKKNQPSSS